VLCKNSPDFLQKRGVRILVLQSFFK
jgi:hypothetical protein